MWPLVILQPKVRNLSVTSTQQMAIASLPYLCDLHRHVQREEKRFYEVLQRSNNGTSVHFGFSFDMQTKGHDVKVIAPLKGR